MLPQLQRGYNSSVTARQAGMKERENSGKALGTTPAPSTQPLQDHHSVWQYMWASQESSGHDKRDPPNQCAYWARGLTGRGWVTCKKQWLPPWSGEIAFTSRSGRRCSGLRGPHTWAPQEWTCRHVFTGVWGAALARGAAMSHKERIPNTGQGKIWIGHTTDISNWTDRVSISNWKCPGHLLLSSQDTTEKWERCVQQSTADLRIVKPQCLCTPAEQRHPSEPVILQSGAEPKTERDRC